MTKAQILTKAATSMLAQANASKQDFTDASSRLILILIDKNHL